MEVRDAVEADAPRLAELADAPTDVMRNLIHDRTVRVAVEPDGERVGTRDGETGDGESGRTDGDGTEKTADTDEPDARSGSVGTPNIDNPNEQAGSVVGFVSFDAKRRTVHVTQMEGSGAAVRRLLEEPRRFAATEGMSVELLIAAGNDTHREAAEDAGFGEEGHGPRFDGTPTVRYRLDLA